MLDDQADVSVIDQQAIAGCGVPCEILVGGRHPVVSAFAVVDGDAHRLAVGPICGSPGEPPEPDLRTLQIGKDADRSPGDVGCRANPLVAGLVIRILAVAEIEPRHVHASLNQRPDNVVFTGRRTESADDLSASSHDVSA